ncbi:ThiF family protein [Ancylostoma ceylanicum]|uniref:SUMO-activating enzyme subunit n=1 Tax=Ancylostoma ceylanicum TaxID=53326 RepID=A0A0D6M0L3_9BILA|nr:ThiF family protein [Ancylostoma ceylanicum]
MGWKEKEAKKLAGKRVLVIGAGGIGCELLKNIALTGFKDIHVIDMDTIDVSNLNRQFLFRREHVGRSKAEVATEAIRQMCPDIKITFDLENIFSKNLNALFPAARNHVNRMCLAAKVPLIESGSAGYLGQVRSIIRDRTECYECVPKPPQEKTFPGCTIRNTPSEHIHCTVWSKHAFNQLFGELDIDDDISPDLTDTGERADGVSNNADAEMPPADGHSGEQSAENGAAQSSSKNGESSEDCNKEKPISTRAWAENVNYDPEKIFDKLFNDDIVYLLRMEHLWRERRAPVPIKRADAVTETMSSSSASASSTKDIDMDTIDVSNLNRQFLFRREHVGRSKAEVATEAIRQMCPDIKITFDLENIFSKNLNALFPAARNHVNRMCLAAKVPLIESGSAGYLGQVWSVAECADVFCESVAALSKRKNALTDNSILHWDKDDEDAMRFVGACANIRATIFGIPRKSLFEIKSMAGNIIPAIATTNAIVAGMVVVEAMKIISEELDKLRVVFINRAPNPRGKILVDQIPFTPNPNCFVCSDKRECFIKLNPEQMTVKALQDKVLKGALNMVAPDVIEATTSRIVISSEEGETADLEAKMLSELSIGNGSMLMCDDFQQKLELKLILAECKTLKGDEFEVLQDSGEVKENVDEESRKRKSMATPEVLDGETAAKRVKL